MLCDFHLHTDFSGDSETPAAAQIERAIALGMKELCITDHHDYDSHNTGTPFLLDFSSYFPSLDALRSRYAGQIRLNIGVELGLLLHDQATLEGIPSQYAFDYVIGSSHFIDDQDPYYPVFFEGKNERNAYERYFEVTLARVKAMTCFDVFGHLDYIVRYGPNQNQFYSYQAYQDFIDPILKTLIEKGKGLECNTGGLKYGLGHPNPCEDILKRYHALGGEILTVGSDAHSPEHLGYAFDKLPELLKSCGFKYYTVFHERKPEFLLI